MKNDFKFLYHFFHHAMFHLTFFLSLVLTLSLFFLRASKQLCRRSFRHRRRSSWREPAWRVRKTCGSQRRQAVSTAWAGRKMKPKWEDMRKQPGRLKKRVSFFLKKVAFQWKGVILFSKIRTIIRFSLFFFCFISFYEVVFRGKAGYSMCAGKSFPGIDFVYTYPMKGDSHHEPDSEKLVAT